MPKGTARKRRQIRQLKEGGLPPTGSVLDQAELCDECGQSDGHRAWCLAEEDLD